ncbi:MAG: thioredoxin family protein [Gammaproteobacteria bacterium]|jgi:glutaredoxin|uniref:thioredoxin family protein n=1 Tax=Marinomonas sp. ef1 TaxID=2005043 RepID=UPI000C2898D4|nr:thioredoxin family protein [Marinomonas sp. ef1]MBU1296126.1 thioredoxin family protein [Gammaproteobacteria bacterium]MBU1468813.1 thioredoxin family protein [Gammaproteobacteria bacterium]MBU2022388.1 thioredoxin family protein [Gammaproteobacteria bacterium]MBU2239460.1 thioredoxin family protein [Gammaproteobacteria bacterium]
MKQVKVLGSGCSKCVKTAELIKAIAAENEVPVNVEKETSAEVIMSYGVMSTPAVVIDDVVVHYGSIPDKKKIQSWF